MDIFSLLLPKYTIDKNKKIRLISLFSGYDSQKLAFNYLEIDVEHYRAIEFDKYAIQSLNEIHGTNFTTNDITKINADDLGIVDTENFAYILTYSFPCTDLSLAGKRAGMDRDSGTRSGLLWEVERLLREIKEKPQILIMENVPQVLSAKGWREWNVFLEGLGYSNYTQVLNAKNFGIPQNRERCFMVSILGNYSYEFPKPFELKDRLKDFLENNVDEKYYLSKKMKSYIFSKNDKYQVSESSLILNRGVVVKEIEPKLVGGFGEKKSNGGSQWYQQDRVYDGENIAMCHCANIPSGSYNYQLSDLRIRKLTPCECFKLMGVKPSDYNKITCSNAQKYKQAGNSIVTTCLMAIYSGFFENCDYKYYINKLINELKVSD